MSSRECRQAIDREARENAIRQNLTDFERGELLLRARESGVEQDFGWTFWEWVERRLGLGRRAAEDRMRVARALERLPSIRERCARGELLFSRVRELVRVAAEENELEWLEATASMTGAQIAQKVNGLERGDSPEVAAKPEAMRHRVVLDLSPKAKAMLDAARVRLTREAEGHVDDDALVMSAMGALMDRASGESKGGATHLVQMTVCEDCGHGEYAGGVVATRDEVSAAMCDARVVPADGSRAKRSVTPKTKQRVLSKQSCECAVPGCRNRAFVDTHHLVPQCEDGTHDEENLVGLCSAHHKSAHRGALVIRKRGGEIWFEHADGFELGDSRSLLERCQVLVAAFDVLVSRGFNETEAQAHLDRVRTAVRVGDSVARVLALADQARRWAA